MDFQQLKSVISKQIILFPWVYGIIILIVGISFHTTGSYYIDSENDFFNSYIDHAEKLLTGNLVVDDFRGPLYIIILAAIKFLINDYLQAGIIISSISSAIFLLFLFRFSKLLLTKNVAIFILIFTAVNPHFIKFSYGAGTDMFCMALIISGLYYFYRGGGYGNIIAAGILLSLAFLTRYNVAIFLIIIPVALIIKGVANKEGVYYKKVAAFLLVTIIITAPWGIYTKQKMGEYFYNKNYKNIALSMGNEKTFDWEKAWLTQGEKYESLGELIAEENINIAVSAAGNIFTNSYKDLKFLMDWLWAPFILIGLILLFYERRREDIKYLLPFTVYFISLLIVFYSTRFSLFLLPMYGLLAYKGVEWFLNNIKLKVQPLKLAAVSLLFIASLLSGIWYNSYIIAPPELNELLAQLEEKNKTVKGEKIAAMRPHIAYHLGMKWETIPFKETLEEVLKELILKRVDYLFIGEAELKKRGFLEELIEPEEMPDRLKEIVRIRNEAVILYKIIY